jgi:predicted DNA-binding transcriptional regulator AlpA
MDGTTLNLDPKFLYTQEQLVPVFQKSTSWFERARWAGEGPKYRKIGRSVRYLGADVLEWLDAQTRGSTSEGVR